MNAHREFDSPAVYEIRVKAQLDAPWSEWFDGFMVDPCGRGETRLMGPVVDQAALHGLLNRIRDLGLPLLSLRRLPDDEPLQGDLDYA